MSDRVLVIGSDGQLAQAIISRAPESHVCTGRNRLQLDICDADAIDSVLRELAPSLVINGAAYNAVDAAEGDGLEAAIATNTLAVGFLARACRRQDIPLIHFSTDLVFDGLKRSPYTEEDNTRPLGVYGSSKLAGENLALCASPGNIVIRVCRLFGPTANGDQGSPKKPFGNFPKLMLRLARERGKVRVVNDQIGTPSYTIDVAAAIWELIHNTNGGLYQLSNEGEVSFSDYAAEIFRLADVPCEIEAVSSVEYCATAKRPLHSVMSSMKAYLAGVTPLRDWKDALAEYLHQE